MMEISGRWINIFKVPVSLLKQSEILNFCDQWMMSDKQYHIVTANPEILLKARKDPWMNRILREASLVTADGAGVCWAANFFELSKDSKSFILIIKTYLLTLFKLVFGKAEERKLIPERVSGSDLMWEIIKMADKHQKKIYLLGGFKGTALRAANKIKENSPSLDIEAFPYDHVATPYSFYELNNAIEVFSPDIIFVAYGSPKQEEWIRQNLSRYPSVKIAMGIGGALDFIAGNTSRAPLRLRKHGLEWFWRFYQRPTRIVRVLRATVEFPTFILFSRLKRLYAKK